VPRVECGERSLTLTLNREYQISAIRVWFHDIPPALVWVVLQGSSVTTRKQLRDATNNGSRETHETFLQNTYDSLGESYISLPMTFHFSPVAASDVTLAFDTCTSLDPADFERYRAGEQREDGKDIAPQIGWLLEFEVFAEPEWHEAWYWRLTGW
jgi:hypothetical protein